jgi:HK97 family phage major capsid protein
MKILELRQQRKDLADKAHAIITKAGADKRSVLNTEENAEFDKIMEDVDKLAETIQRAERSQTVQTELTASAGRSSNPAAPATTEPTGNTENRTEASEAEQREAARVVAFRSWLKGGIGELSRDEKRSLYAGADVSGGYLVLPQQMQNQLIKNIDNQVFLRGLATSVQVTAAESIGVPTLENDPDDADWTTELKTGTEDSTMSFGKRAMTPHPVAKRIKLSDKLLRLVQNADTLTLQRLGYKMGITQEKAFLTGDGNKKPLGVFTASANGIDTDRDTSVGTAAITADGLIDTLYALKGQYQGTCVGLTSRTGMKQIRKLKDSQNRYLWEPNLQAGQPDLVLGRPMYMSEYVPVVFTAGNYVGMWADFKHYWIVDALTYSVKRLDELYAETAQIGFIVRAELDGGPVLPEAFSRWVTS